ncbi:MAG TPA: ABC transporter ATP-binding protein [Terracidiphilus sp.]|nr:ABC transporter ATP-binding protein [Terracidiphilus sp.]
MELRIDGLNKVYKGGVRALDNVNLTIPRGLYGLLGPNGAGKSTLMRTIATLQEPDSGSIRMGDLDVLRSKEEVRKILGYLPQDFGVYPRVNAEEMLDQIALLKGIVNGRQRKEVVHEMLHRVNLWEVRKKRLTGYSGGMRQRFGIAQALIGDPKLLIVDEPTAGLDPGERNRFYNLLAEIGDNVIVILSTHIVEDVTDLCSNMAIIHLGKVLFAGAPDHAVTSLEGRVWRKSIEREQVKEYTSRMHVISNKLVAGRPLIHVFADTSPEEGFIPVIPDLEDVFFARIAGLN